MTSDRYSVATFQPARPVLTECCGQPIDGPCRPGCVNDPNRCDSCQVRPAVATFSEGHPAAVVSRLCRDCAAILATEYPDLADCVTFDLDGPCSACGAAVVVRDVGPTVRLCADCAALSDAYDGAIPEPDDDPAGTMAELARLTADRIDADRVAWSGLVRMGRHQTAHAVRAGAYHPTDLGALSGLVGLVPWPAIGSAAARGHELVQVWSAIMAQSRAAAELRSELAAGRDGRYASSAWHAYPGDRAADIEASEERYNLSPSGRWSVALPPIYAAGAWPSNRLPHRCAAHGWTVDRCPWHELDTSR